MRTRFGTFERCTIAVLAVALLAAGHQPSATPDSLPDRFPDESETTRDPQSLDPQSLVGRSWNSIRPRVCQGETLLRSTEPLRTYVIATWQGRSLYIYRAGGPIFGVADADDARPLESQSIRAGLEILGVVDLGVVD